MKQKLNVFDCEKFNKIAQNTDKLRVKSTRWQDKFLSHFKFLFFVFTLLNAMFAFAGPTRTTYQAKIIKPDGHPLEASNVNFKFTILDPSGSCIIFAETYSSVNMTSTGGLISFSLGSGVKTFPVSGTTFEQIFSNITPNIACDTGGAPAVYTPLANDARKIVMQFHDGGGWQTLPAMNINAVPYAMYANDSQKFNGLVPSDFVQVSTVPTCTASQALRYTGSNFQCVATGDSGSVTSGSVITALGYTPADDANLSTVTNYATNVSSTVFSVSSTVSSLSNSVSTLQSSVAASFAAIVNSQWITSGTTISYNAGRVGVGTDNPAYNLHVMQSVSGSTQVTIDAYSGTPGLYFRKANGTAAAPLAVSSTSPLLEIAAVGHGQTGFISSSAAKILMVSEEDWTDATAAASIRFHTRGSSTTAPSLERMRIDKNGNVGIGTGTPITKLEVSGGVRISMEAAACAVSYAGTLRYNSGVVEYCNGTSWSAFGVAGSGLASFNGSTSATQTLAAGFGGTAPSFSTINGVHTINIPNAASASVTAGLLSNADYQNFTNKMNATSSSVISALGYTPASATPNAIATYQVRVATSANITLSGNQTIDGVSVIADDRVLVKNQSAQSENGVYVVTAGAWTRATDMNSWEKTIGYTAQVAEGTAWAGMTFISNTTAGGTLNSTVVAWTSAGSTGSNTANGLGALGSNTAGTTNTANGVNSLLSNTSGSDNTATGAGSLLLNTTGSYNTANGVNSLFSNTSGSYNTANGYRSLYFNAGNYNTATGYRSLYLNSTGNNNTAAGYNALTNTTGSNNTGIGFSAGSAITTGSNNVVIGSNTGSNFATDSNNISISDGSGNERIRVVSSGNVGVGTTAPEEKFHVSNGWLLLDNTYGVRLKSTSGAVTNALRTGVNDQLVVGSGGWNSISFHTGAADKLYIASSGAVGVGTITPVSLMHISGEESYQFHISGASNTNKRLRLGYDTTNNYGAIQALTYGSTYDNLLLNPAGGNVGIGLVSPTARLHIVSGSATKAAFKLTSGTLLASPESGTIEYDGFNYYVTDGANTRRAIVTDTGNYSNVNSISSSGNMILAPTGSVVVSGGLSVATSLVAPTIYGGSSPSGNLTIDSTSNVTKGNILLAPSGGRVGVGTANPTGALHVAVNNAATTFATVSDAIIFQNTNTTSNALTSIMFTNQNGFATGQIAALQNTGNFGSQMILGTKFAGSGAWNNSQFVLDPSGNVGIGTTAPLAKLQVNGNVLIDGATNDSSNFIVRDNSTSGTWNIDSYSGRLRIFTEAGIDVGGGTERMTLTTSGNVGIGTVAPGARLHVATPANGGVNNRLVMGNSNSDLIDVTNVSGDSYLDHSVSARFYATASTTLTRAVTFKIDGAPTVSGTNLTIAEPLAFWVQAGNSSFGGNLGVGTTTPSSRLTVKDSLAITSTAGIQYLLMGNQDSAGTSHPSIIRAANGNLEIGSGSSWAATGDTFTSKFWFGDDGKLGVGTDIPSGKLSNIPTSAVNANPGDANGTGENANSLNWETAAAGYSAAITNNSLTSAANGLNIRTLGITANHTILAAGVGVSSTANSYDVLTVKANKQVGINTSTPLQPLTVNGGFALQPAANDHIYMEFYARTATPTTRSGWFGYGSAGTDLMQITNGISGGHMNLMTTGTGKVGINQTSPSYALDVNGTLRGYGITDSSDIRLKKDIQPLDLSLEKILQVEGVSYHWKDKEKSNKKQIGFIAQQLEKIYPELVETDKFGMKSVNYSHLVAPLVEAVKSIYARLINVEAKQEQQSREIANVKAENIEIKAENAKLKERLDRLEKALNEKK